MNEVASGAGRRFWKKTLLGVLMFAIAALAFSWGRRGALSEATANPPGSDAAPNQPMMQTSGTDYGNRVVAFIYNNMPITRDDLGEYLIARFGTQRVEFLVNRRVIEMECKRRGIFVTDAEVEAQLQEDLKSFGPAPITRREFVNQILRRFNKTLYEWQEDVIRPKLALAKLARPRVQVTEKDLRDGFDARYGEKVECRMIAIQPGTPDDKRSEIWTKATKSEDEFRELARKQYIPALAEQGGKVPPIHQHFGDADIEREAFSLKPGDVSKTIGLSDKSFVILKCDKRIPPDTTKSFENEKLTLQREIYEHKLQMEIPKVFQELRAAANVTILLRDQIREEDLKRDSKAEIEELNKQR